MGRNIAIERSDNMAQQAPHGRCEVCFRPLVPPARRRQGGGRPRQTCTPACRQLKYRLGSTLDELDNVS